MELYGRKWTKRELEARVGRLEQIAGLRRFRLDEGLEEGLEQIQVRTGSGLCYYTTLSGGLDISLAEFAGIPLSRSPSGDFHPSYYNPEGAEGLLIAAGGLLMTCGLTYVGAPGKDKGYHGLGLEHGNFYVKGRASERRRGSLVLLCSGCSRNYQLKLEVGRGP